MCRAVRQAQARGGAGAAGLTRRGLAGLDATGTRLFRPFHLLLLAEAELAAGAVGAAQKTLDEVLAVVLRQEELWLEGKLRCRRGLALLVTGAAGDEAEACLLAALASARSRGTRSWELRAATSLAGCWAEWGERRKARDLLGPIHGYLTEGFATPDLNDAST